MSATPARSIPVPTEEKPLSIENALPSDIRTIHGVRHKTKTTPVAELEYVDESGLNRRLSNAEVPVDLDEELTDEVSRAVKYGRTRDNKRQWLVSELLKAGSFTKARRVASCGNHTGNGQYYCGCYRLCPTCTPGNDAQDNYADAVKEWNRWTWTAFHDSQTYPHPVTARRSMLGIFSKLKRRRVPVDREWLGKIRRFDIDHARDLREYVDAGRSVPFGELTKSGIAGVHLQQVPGGFRAHLDVLCGAPWIEADVLESTLRDCGGGSVLVPMRLRTDDGDGDVVQPVTAGDLDGGILDGDRRPFSEAVEKSVAYVSDTTDIEDPEARVEYDLMTNGEHPIRPWGL